MVFLSFRLRDEPIDEPLREGPDQVELFGESNSMSSRYTPDLSLPRDEPIVKIRGFYFQT